MHRIRADLPRGFKPQVLRDGVYLTGFARRPWVSGWAGAEDEAGRW